MDDKPYRQTTQMVGFIFVYFVSLQIGVNVL